MLPIFIQLLDDPFWKLEGATLKMAVEDRTELTISSLPPSERKS